MFTKFYNNTFKYLSHFYICKITFLLFWIFCMRRKKDRSNGITALYERLSRDDDNAGESNSIVHQKQMLEDYAMKHGFTNLVHFTDDGWSGATFDRPSWNRLVEGVKNGEITACICKDMSRIGRDHLQVGFFPDKPLIHDIQKRGKLTGFLTVTVNTIIDCYKSNFLFSKQTC